jgi:hypothetical protein
MMEANKKDVEAEKKVGRGCRRPSNDGERRLRCDWGSGLLEVQGLQSWKSGG